MLTDVLVRVGGALRACDAVQPGLQTAAAHSLTTSTEKREQLERHVARLAVVRTNKAAAALGGDDEDDERRDADLYSDTSSIAPSLRTRSTKSGASSKHSAKSTVRRRFRPNRFQHAAAEQARAAQAHEPARGRPL